MVTVNINTATVSAGIATPGGVLSVAMDEWLTGIKSTAFALSPVNNPLNATHRGGVVGTYERSWRASKNAPVGARLTGEVVNDADHAVFVEFGRSASRKPQRFGWVETGGRVLWWKGTSARRGQYPLTIATNAVMGVQVGATPLALI